MADQTIDRTVETVAVTDKVLGEDELQRMIRYWQAANYLCAGMLYLVENPLLREPLKVEAHQAAPAGSLGDGSGTDVSLGAHEPGDQEV